MLFWGPARASLRPAATLTAQLRRKGHGSRARHSVSFERIQPSKQHCLNVLQWDVQVWGRWDLPCPRKRTQEICAFCLCKATGVKGCPLLSLVAWTAAECNHLMPGYSPVLCWGSTPPPRFYTEGWTWTEGHENSALPHILQTRLTCLERSRLLTERCWEINTLKTLKRAFCNCRVI